MSRLIQPSGGSSLQASVTPAREETSVRESSPLEEVLVELRTQRHTFGGAGSIGANFGSAVEAIWANRGRSFLTALGIFIGIAAVIAALILTQGVSAYINSIIGLGANTIIIFPNTAKSTGASLGQGSGSSLTQYDTQTLSHVAHVTGVSPIISTFDQVVYSNQHWTTQVEGVSSDFQSIQNWQIAQGSWFSTDDVNNGTPVAVLGDTVAHNLFDASGTNPVNQKIRIRDQIFQVVGVLAPQGGAFAQDDLILVPFRAEQIRLSNTNYVSEVMLQVDTVDNVVSTQQLVENALRQSHHLRPEATDDFAMFSSLQILQRAQQTSQILTTLLVGIAAISLTVGGIGIMNIMLVSVTERTWEIGIRMSIGARRRDILNQFLIEALVLCLLAGLIGLVLGLLIGLAVVHAAGMPFVVTATTLILPFAVSTAIAIVFGLYPAIRASRLDPIVAIRTDD